MAKFTLAKTTNLTPAFFEGLKYAHGGTSALAKKMKVSPQLISSFAQGKTPSNDSLIRMTKGLNRVSRGNAEVAEKFASIKRVRITPGQTAYMAKETAQGEKQRQYFRKAVREAYEKNFRHIRYGAIDPATGKTFSTSPKMRKVRRGRGKRVHRARRRGH